MRFIAVDDLKPGMRLGRKIINQKKSSMLEKGIILSKFHIDKLKESGYMGAYIADEFSEDIEIQETVLERHIERGIDAVASQNIGDIMDVAETLVEDICSLERISVDMVDLRSYDDYTYHHSVNVAIYAVAVGTWMGMPDSQLQELCVAALCHDLGKSQISADIVNKRGRLTDEEFELIKRHPQYGYDMLYMDNFIPAVVRQAVLCHHENENGSGYPLGKAGNAIPLYAKIIHAVDVYDALTSRRPYKEPYAPVEALEYMVGGIDILFNKKVVEAMQNVIPAYPPGMEVGLSNGERGVVVAHTARAGRPRIKLFDTGMEIDLLNDLDYMTVFITSSGILKQHSGVKELNENRGKPKAPERRKTILVVDDSSIALRQAKLALENEYDVVTLESGKACINYVSAKGAPDLIIMDIDMPGLNGVLTVEMLKEMKIKDLKVVFLTAIANKEIVVRCNKAGAKDYILKPVNPIYLRERVKIALDKNLDR